MEALYFGNDEAWWRERPTNKSGPWIMAVRFAAARLLLVCFLAC
jgi:hypothetical protein